MSPFIINRIFNSITYILPTGNEKNCWLVDCGDVEKVIEQGWQVRGVLLTHAHFDHIYGLNKLMDTFPTASVYTNVEGKESLITPRWNFSHYHEDVEDFVFAHPENVRVIEEESTIDLGGMQVEVFIVPGHDPSCLAFRIEDALYTGDAYIPRVKVVTSFPRSNKLQAAKSLARLQQLEALGLIVWPGHII